LNMELKALFKLSPAAAIKYFKAKEMPELDTTQFMRGGQMKLF